MINDKNLIEQKQELLKLEKKYQGTAEQIRRGTSNTLLKYMQWRVYLLFLIEMDKENMAIENLQRSVDKLRDKQRGLPEKLDTYKRETKHEEDLLEAKRAKMEEIERSRKEKIQQLLGAIAVYKERLGLSFESIGGKFAVDHAIKGACVNDLIPRLSYAL